MENIPREKIDQWAALFEKARAELIVKDGEGKFYVVTDSGVVDGPYDDYNETYLQALGHHAVGTFIVWST